jgi:serine/threonine protein kinase
MSSSPKVIGEGSYGCVHSPSLLCKGKPKLKYHHKVSKTISRYDAAKEMREYKGISTADKDNEFYLGKPIQCDIQDIAMNKDAIQKCKIGQNVLNNLSNYKLIVMNDGGENLETYSKKVRMWPISNESTRKCELFLLEAIRLFRGLIVFKENDLIHHDLKPQNIVYNEKENRLNYIDFGLMQSKSKVKERLLKGGNYSFSIFHWSFPWETRFLNKRAFANIKNYGKKHLINDYNNGSGDYPHLQNFFYYSIDRYINNDQYEDEINNVFDNYDDFIKDVSITKTHSEFVDKCLDSIDVYGLGLAMMFWLHNAKQHLDNRLNVGFQIIFGKMLSANESKRLMADEVLDWTERLLEVSGVLSKHKKIIVDHEIVDEGEVPKDKVQAIVKTKAKVDRFLADADPGTCPEGKERNPSTMRCVKACPEGKKRNQQFKCVKAEESECPAGKERNPKTRRCVTVCPKGKKRNGEFKCVKDVAVSTECPDGKERNPKTRRCVNKCKSGYERNSEFKCVKTRKSRH